MRNIIKVLVEDKRFQNTIIALIILNGITMGLYLLGDFYYRQLDHCYSG